MSDLWKNRKPPKAVMLALMVRWPDEIFPAMFLVYGRPPTILGKVLRQEHLDAWAAQKRYHRAIKCFYHHAYLSSYSIINIIVCKHLHQFAMEFRSYAYNLEPEEY